MKNNDGKKKIVDVFVSFERPLTEKRPQTVE